MATLSTTVDGYTLAAGGYLTITNTGVIDPPGLLAQAASRVVSSGSIVGTGGTNGSKSGNHDGQQGAIAAVFASSSTFTNSVGGQVTGGSGGNGAYGGSGTIVFGGNGGAGASGAFSSSGSVANHGVIVGGNGGLGGKRNCREPPPAGGAGGAACLRQRFPQ